MKPTPLRSLIKNIETNLLFGDKSSINSTIVRGISTDSRTLKKGDVFIAIKGDRLDGHNFVGDAIGKGAAGVIIEKAKLSSLENHLKCIKKKNVFLIGVEDTRKVLGNIAKNYLKHFSTKRIAITGSSGKTTCKSLIAAILAENYKVVSSEKSFNNDIGVPKTIFRIDDHTEFLVQEMGTNKPGEIRYLSDIVQQEYALITNIGPAHVGFFGSIDEIAREKRAAVEVLPDGGAAFLNAEDRYFDFLSSGTKAEIRSFGLKSGDIFVTGINSMDIGGTRFRIKNNEYFTRLTGYHGLLNTLACILMGRYFGITDRDIKEVLKNYTPEEGRGVVEVINGITILDESYNANPVSVKRCLDFFGRIQVGGKKIFVFSDMLELGNQSLKYHQEIGRLISKSGVDILLTYGKMAEITAKECKKLGCLKVESFPDIESLSKRLVELATENDALLIKGSRLMGLERVKKNFSNLLVLSEV